MGDSSCSDACEANGPFYIGIKLAKTQCIALGYLVDQITDSPASVSRQLIVFSFFPRTLLFVAVPATRNTTTY